MRRIADQEHAPRAVAVRDQLAPDPRHHRQDLEIELAAHGPRRSRRGFPPRSRRASRRPPTKEKRHGPSPLIATIVAQVPSGPMKMYRYAGALWCSDVESVATEDRVGRVGQHLVAGHRDAELLAHRAAAAVAGRQDSRPRSSRSRRCPCRAIPRVTPASSSAKDSQLRAVADLARAGRTHEACRIGSNMSCGMRSRFSGLCGGPCSSARAGNGSRPSS